MCIVPCIRVDMRYILHPPSVQEAMIGRHSNVSGNLPETIWEISFIWFWLERWNKMSVEGNLGPADNLNCWIFMELCTLMHILQFLFISSVRPAGFLWELVTFNFTYSLFTQVGSGVAWERNFWQYPFVKELGSYSSLPYFVSSFILHKLNKIVFYPRFWWSLFCAVCVSSSQ